MPSGHPLPKGNESYHFFHRLTTCFRMHISDTQWRGTNTSPSLHHRRHHRLQHHLRQGTLAPQLQPAAWTIELAINCNWNEIINRVLYRSYSFTHLGKHIHQLGHYVTITLGIDEAGGLAQIPHPAGTSCVQNNLSMQQ